MNQVQFGSIRSYDDMGLFLADVDIETPQAKRTLVDVYGRDGELDLTYGLGGDTCFENRKITLLFAMKNYKFQWKPLFSEVMNRLHGRKFKVWIEPEADRYWDAFCTVNTARCDRNRGTVEIELDADPYMYRDYEISVTATTGGTEIAIPITRKTAVPTITSSANIVIVKDETNYSFDSGTHKNEALRLKEGENVLTVKGSGTVTIAYKDGSL